MAQIATRQRSLTANGVVVASVALSWFPGLSKGGEGRRVVPSEINIRFRPRPSVCQV